jgi:hypothetical protein
MTTVYVSYASEPAATTCANADTLLGTVGGTSQNVSRAVLLTGKSGEDTTLRNNAADASVVVADDGDVTITAPSGKDITLAGHVVTTELRVFTKNGAPVDGDFDNPVNGLIAIDTSTSKLYLRVGGSWVASAAFA